MSKESNTTETAIDANTVLTPVVVDLFSNDGMIKACNKCLEDLFNSKMVRYKQLPNGKFEVINDDRFNKLVEEINDQIEFRKQQIMSVYNWR